MTPLDLRIRYKSQTGQAPTYGRALPEVCCNYQGGLTHDYAVWLEATDKQRIYFKRDTSKDATYYKNNLLYYTKEYKEWLEERMCKVYTILKKLKK